jgi:hypothetical protein
METLSMKTLGMEIINIGTLPHYGVYHYDSSRLNLGDIPFGTKGNNVNSTG